VVEFNPAAERTFGYRKSDVQGQELAMLIVPPEHREAHRRGLARYVATGQSHLVGRLIEMSALKADGSQFPIELAITAVESDGPLMLTGVARNITERKRTDEIRRQSQAIEQQNRRMLEANRLKSEFVANMSHELRTPLNAIIGFADLMYKGKVGPVSAEHQEYLGDILTSSKHLLQLINDVLDLAKVESGRMDFRPEPVDLARLVGEVNDILRGMAASKRLSVHAEVDPRVTAAVVDPGRVKQILYNYLSNAIKFTPDGGAVTITVRPEAADQFRIDVRDSGVGIAAANMNKLFVEFQQLDLSTSKRYHGTGLGLALTKRIVEAQGGYVAVDSAVGVGSTFSAVLPRIMSLGSPDLPAAPSLGRAPAGAARRVLVVDDDRNALKIAAATLRDAGVYAVCVTNGEEALRIAAVDQPAVVVVDLLMPHMNGFEFIERFRRTLNGSAVPIIAWTVKDLDAGERDRLRSERVALAVKRSGGAASLMEELWRVLAVDSTVNSRTYGV
jgi:PAS domain S-box-containing protein